jgi:glucan phosphoethanolaminetransferase (alkaline phosphatase superfamily)
MDAESRERLVNSYDNAILYNLDKFFRILIDKMNLEHTILIYTSDHGQTLGEEGLVSTHARKSRGVMNIPLFIVTTMKLFPKTGLAPTHENIFPTLLNIMKVPLENWASNYSSPLVEK